MAKRTKDPRCPKGHTLKQHEDMGWTCVEHVKAEEKCKHICSDFSLPDGGADNRGVIVDCICSKCGKSGSLYAPFSDVQWED